jgi:zona occludens toxin (predicted ATPase)
MNERINELLSQAISDVDYIRDDDALNEDLSQMFIPDCFAERFAELIVKECADVCKRNILVLTEYDSDNAEGRNDGSEECAYLIKRHFGVE